MDSPATIDAPILSQESGIRPNLPRLVTDDLQGRVNSLASALIMQGYEPTLVRLRAGIGRTPHEILQRAFEYWKAHVRPKIGKAPERVSTWGNEVAVPDAIRDLFSETWRRTLIAARMTNHYSDETLDRATVSEETRAIRACVDRLERLLAEHQEQRRVDAEIFRSLTMRLAQACAESEAVHARLEGKVANCERVVDNLKQKLIGMKGSLDCAQLEAIEALAKWRRHLVKTTPTARSSRMKKRRARR
jgi:hypothetical protein